MLPYDALVTLLRERIAGDYEPLFADFLTLKGTGAERMAFCVFHENTESPSMAVNVEEGLYRCHNPSCGQSGDLITFYRHVRSLTFQEAVREIAHRVGVDPDAVLGAPRASGTGPIDPEAVRAKSESLLAGFDLAAFTLPPEPSDTPVTPMRAVPTPKVEKPEREIDPALPAAFHTRCLATPAHMAYLEGKRGLTVDTIERFQIGHDGERFTIPVRDLEGKVRNIRRYSPTASAEAKMLPWRAGFGLARLFPLHELEPEGTVYLFEGEWDTLIARQIGLNALTGTGGAGTWRKDWSTLLAGRDVVICYDNDEAGHNGARIVAGHLHGIAGRIRIVKLPLAEKGADLSDFVVKHGLGKTDFCALVDVARDYAPGEDDGPPPARREPLQLHLSKASEAIHYNQPVRMNVMVSGKTTAPYIVPQEVKLSCSMPGKPMCASCPVADKGGTLVRQMEFTTNEVLQFTNVPDATVKKMVQGKSRVPGKCAYVQQQVTKAMNIEEIHLIPEVERGESEGSYVTRVASFLGHGLRTNCSYVVTGTTVPDPKRQLATHIITDAIPSQSNIDAFRLTPQVVERLRAFQPPQSGVQGLWSHLHTIYADLEAVTRIHQRQDIMTAVDLTYHSIIAFDFQGDRVRRGWTELLVIGDSRTGKTQTVERMVGHYGAGELTTGENTSFAGLVGGLEQIGTSWSLRWGRVPLNDRRLLVVDEAGNLSQEHIGRMSSMRSSGVAEVIKIHTERTEARTRQIWISNPRNNRTLSSYSQGVLAVKELIGAPEDIARFDMVVTASSTDVPLNIVNSVRSHSAPTTFTADLCHQRVMWAWSRRAEDVTWAEGAEQTVLDIAARHGERYRHATDIPLVEPNEQRIKLARLAVAAAVMFYSTDEEGRRVIVRPEHAQFAAEFLEATYKKPSLAFDEFADAMMRRHEITDKEEVLKVLRKNRHCAQAMLEQEHFSQRDIAEIFEYDDRRDLRVTVTLFRDSGFLRRGLNSTYVKTPGAIQLLREELHRRTQSPFVPDPTGGIRMAYGAAMGEPTRNGSGPGHPGADPGSLPPWLDDDD